METLMDDVCGYIKNFFVVKPNGIHRGTFRIEDSTMEVPFLRENQYFRIVGSIFNDGVYRYPAVDLQDEEFDGEIWAMAVPPAFIALMNEIEEWQSKYGGANSINMSPYASESFNNYSYSKRSGGSGNHASGSDTPVTWKDAFATNLTRWRKI